MEPAPLSAAERRAAAAALAAAVQVRLEAWCGDLDSCSRGCVLRGPGLMGSHHALPLYSERPSPAPLPTIDPDLHAPSP